jgi:hypothetical protein
MSDFSCPTRGWPAAFLRRIFGLTLAAQPRSSWAGPMTGEPAKAAVPAGAKAGGRKGLTMIDNSQISDHDVERCVDLG